MKPEYRCSNCEFFDPNEEGCRRYPHTTPHKEPTEYCGEHSQYNKELHVLTHTEAINKFWATPIKQ